MYQRLIRHDFPVYLVMTGIAKELQSLQDEKSLTFLTRALKITIETLNVTRIRAKYQEVLKIDYELADSMAKFVKGYTYSPNRGKLISKYPCLTGLTTPCLINLIRYVEKEGDVIFNLFLTHSTLAIPSSAM